MKFGLKFILAMSILPTVLWANGNSSIVGRVLHAADSTPAIGATVTLPGDALDNGMQIKTADNNGYYRFDNVDSGTHIVSASAATYLGASSGFFSLVANSIDTVPALYLIRSTGIVSGIVARADSTNIVLKNAKMVFSINGVKVDSVLSDTSGHYNLTLNAATYTMKSSLAGYRSDQGLITRDTTVTVSFGQTTTSLVYLTPATDTIKGNITTGQTSCGPVYAVGARVYIERRMGKTTGYNLWTLIDSTLTDSIGNYSFVGLIPATGAPSTPPAIGVSYNASGGDYRLLVKSNIYGANFDTTQILTSQTPATVVDVAYAPHSETTYSVSLFVASPKTGATACTDIYDVDKRPALINSNRARSIEIYDLNGKLHKTLFVPAGSHMIVPSAFTQGFLFLVK